MACVYAALASSCLRASRLIVTSGRIWNEKNGTVPTTPITALILTFFRAPEQKKGFSFFPVGRPRPALSPKPSPRRLPFSTRKSRSEVQERHDLGGRKLPGEGWGGQDKTRKKDVQKKVGILGRSRSAYVIQIDCLENPIL